LEVELSLGELLRLMRQGGEEARDKEEEEEYWQREFGCQPPRLIMIIKSGLREWPDQVRVVMGGWTASLEATRIAYDHFRSRRGITIVLPSLHFPGANLAPKTPEDGDRTPDGTLKKVALSLGLKWEEDDVYSVISASAFYLELLYLIFGQSEFKEIEIWGHSRGGAVAIVLPYLLAKTDFAANRNWRVFALTPAIGPPDYSAMGVMFDLIVIGKEIVDKLIKQGEIREKVLKFVVGEILKDNTLEEKTKEILKDKHTEVINDPSLREATKKTLGLLVATRKRGKENRLGRLRPPFYSRYPDSMMPVTVVVAEGDMLCPPDSIDQALRGMNKTAGMIIELGDANHYGFASKSFSKQLCGLPEEQRKDERIALEALKEVIKEKEVEIDQIDVDKLIGNIGVLPPLEFSFSAQGQLTGGFLRSEAQRKKEWKERWRQIIGAEEISLSPYDRWIAKKGLEQLKKEGEKDQIREERGADSNDDLWNDPELRDKLAAFSEMAKDKELLEWIKKEFEDQLLPLLLARGLSKEEALGQIEKEWQKIVAGLRD